jgi:glutamine synthetase
MLSVMADMGLPVEKHYHEAAPAQARLGFLLSTLVRAADNMQIYKYVAQNVANQYGKTVTFMPKPVKGDNGSGMPTHQSLWKSERSIFAGNLYADLSESALHYIGGIIRHARALNAFTNPTTNSYKRLVPRFSAPVLLAYASGNRSAACRIPYGAGANGRRVEVRYPDPAANPYLGFAAMLMAGLDGIENKIDPGKPIDRNLRDLSPEELSDMPTVCGSLREALGELRADHAFLLKGDVFTPDQIDAYIVLKCEEVHNFERTPHPIEFEMYYSV